MCVSYRGFPKNKTVSTEVPLRTEYRLTELGESAIPIIRAMDAWGREHSYMFDELGQLKESSIKFIDTSYIYLYIEIYRSIIGTS